MTTSRAADVLRPALPGIGEEIIASIAREVPDYGRAMEGVFGQMVRLGVETALGRFVDDLAGGGSVGAAGTGVDTYVNLGRGEFHAGRSLEALLGAYRVGARVAWRRFVEAGVAGGLEPSDLYAIGEGMFVYIDRLSAESAEGYALEQRAEAGERRRRRRRLVTLLAADPPAAEDDVRAAAAEAGWDPPRELAALVVAVAPAHPPTLAGPAIGEDVADAAERLARGLGPGVLAAALDGVACALVPDPGGPGRRAALEAAVGGLPAAIGPAVEWRRTGHSLRRALAALRLVRAGGLRATTVVWADDHLPALLLGSDPGIAADLAETRLAPLRAVGGTTGARLTDTLRAWLDRPGQVQAIAADLGVHPQTVRYRVRRLRELFGDALDDPERRFELALALRVDAA